MPAEIHSLDPWPSDRVVRFITDMTIQLEALATSAGLDLLAHFLAMAKEEGDFLLCGDDQADDPGGEG